MRISRDGLAVVYVAGLGAKPGPSPLVTVRNGAGVSHALAAGHSPRWITENGVVFGPHEDGQLLSAIAPAWAILPLPLISGNSVAAAPGRVAVHRTDPRRVLTSANQVVPGATDPAYSDDGQWIAYVLPDVPIEGVSRLVVAPAADPIAARLLWEGAPMAPRFGGTTLAFEIGAGQIAACPDVANPAAGATAFPLPAPWRCSKPVPVWMPARGELYVLFVADAGDVGEIKIAEWGSLLAGTPRGYAVGVSSGSAYDHDARGLAASPAIVAIVWLTAAGELDEVRLDLSAPRDELTPPGVPPEPEPPEPEPPDPPEPEPPDPPEPEPPQPENPDMNPTVDMIPRDQTVRAADAIDEYLRANPRLGLPDGIWPADFYAVGNAERLDVISAYLIGAWCPEVCRLGPFPGDAAGWDTRRNLGLDHTFHVIEAERGEKPPPPEPGDVTGPIGVSGSTFTVPD